MTEETCDYALRFTFRAGHTYTTPFTPQTSNEVEEAREVMKAWMQSTGENDAAGTTRIGTVFGESLFYLRLSDVSLIEFIPRPFF